MARMRAALLATTTLAALIWTLTVGSAVASASTRLRSGTLHAQLVSHVSARAGANALSPAGLTVKGSAVMAAIVGLLALAALAFLIVTFIRRRVTVA